MEKLLIQLKKINYKYFGFGSFLSPISSYVYIIENHIYICSNYLVLMFKLENNFPLKNRKIDLDDFLILLSFNEITTQAINNVIYSKSLNSCSIKTIELDNTTDNKIIEFSNIIHDKKNWMWYPDEELHDNILNKLNIKNVFTRDSIYEVKNKIGNCPITLYQKNENNYTPIIAFCKHKGAMI